MLHGHYLSSNSFRICFCVSRQTISFRFNIKTDTSWFISYSCYWKARILTHKKLLCLWMCVCAIVICVRSCSSLLRYLYIIICILLICATPILIFMIRWFSFYLILHLHVMKHANLANKISSDTIPNPGRMIRKHCWYQKQGNASRHVHPRGIFMNKIGSKTLNRETWFHTTAYEERNW